MKKLHLGCGNEYKKGFVNIDFNPDVKTDICCDLEQGIPLEDDSISYVFVSHTLEHINNIFKITEEIWRVCENGAIVEIYAPHYTSINALKEFSHHTYFGINSFSSMVAGEEYGVYKKTEERYNKARFNILQQKLSLFYNDSRLNNTKWLSYFNIFNFLFNFSTFWQLLMERICFAGFEEIYYKLEVVK